MKSYETSLGGSSAIGDYVKRPFASAEQAVPANLLDEARETLRQANAVSSRIMELADRLCGPRPLTSGNGADRDGFSGAFDRFRAEMRDTRQAMIFADDALTRIEQELIG